MALTGISDFEKYPKYQLDKHGRIIKRILNTADSVFNMATENEIPEIQKTVKGGEKILDSQGTSAIFTSQISHIPDQGIINVSLPETADKPKIIPFAIGHFADEASIKSLFSGEGEPNDNTPLVKLETPELCFTQDLKSLFVIDKTNSSFIEPKLGHFCYKIITQTDNTQATETVYQDILDLPTVNNEEIVYQTIEASILGDGVTSTTSDSAVVKRLSVGIPTITITDSDSSIVGTISVPQSELLTKLNADYKLYIATSLYNYETGVLSSSEKTEIAPGSAYELGLGGAIIAWRVCNSPDLFKLTVNQDGQIIACTGDLIVEEPAQIRITNFKTLNPPIFSQNTFNNEFVFSHYTGPNDKIFTQRSFIYSIKKAGLDYFSEEQQYLGDTLVIPVSEGDIVKVKSVADFYNDSAYVVSEPYSEDFTPVDPIIPEIDLAASGIIDIIHFDPDGTEWYS